MIDLSYATTSIALLTIDRPAKRNALDRRLIEQLTRALADVDSDARVRGVILAGAGPSFCAGVDLHEFAEGTPESAQQLINALQALCAALRLHRLPIACAIQGHCLGGALELAACCDLRVCTPDAQFGMPEVFLGIPSVIDAVMLGHVVGAGRARELLLTGESITGETALEWGLANRLAPAWALIDKTVELLERVTRHAPAVIAAQKQLHQQWLDLAYTEAVARSTPPLIESFQAGRPQSEAAARLRKPISPSLG